MVLHRIDITTPDAWPPGEGAPVSNPPGYKFEFHGSKARMHKFGHIWLGPEKKPFTIELEIDQNTSPGFMFQNNGTPDGSLAVFTSDDPARKLGFNGLGGAIRNPTLDPSFTILAFTVDYPGGALVPTVIYYQLNVLDPGGVPVSWDPIVVNQP